MADPTLICCPACKRHHFGHESECPFCAQPSARTIPVAPPIAKAMMAAMTPMVLSACYGVGMLPEKLGDSGLDTGEPMDTGDSGNPDDDAPAPTVSVVWGDTALQVQFAEPVADEMVFGVAETGESDDPWTGEDCASGYVLDDGSTLGPYCHEIPAGSTGIELVYGGDARSLEPGTTAFADASFEGRVTYMLNDGERCWVWGEDTAHFEAMACDEL